MATITQPEIRDEPKPVEAKDTPKPPKVSDQAKPADASGKYSIRKFGKILLYALLVVAAVFLVKYLFFTPPEVTVAQVQQRDYRGEVQGTGTINVDVVAA